MDLKLRLFLYFTTSVTFFFNQINAQTFQGELIYRYHAEVNDPELLERMASLGLQNPNDSISDTKQTLWVNGSMLASKSVGSSGSLRYKQLLDETKAIIQFPGGRTVDYYSATFTNPDKTPLVLLKKVEAFKEIDGYECQKHIYRNEKNQQVIAWISTTIKIDPMVSTLPFFNTFFLAEGLALALSLENDSGQTHWALVALNEREISKEEIIQWFNNES